MTSLLETKVRLEEAVQDLNKKWHLVKEVWQDTARHDFERGYFADFEKITTQIIGQTESLINVVAQAQREVQ